MFPAAFMLKRFLTHGGHFTPDHPEYRRAVLLNITLGVLAGVSLLFAVLNALVFDLQPLVWVDLVALAVAVGLLVELRRSRRIERIALAAVSMFALFLLAYFWVAGNRFYGVIWLTVFPGLAFFLIGARRGLIACLGFFGATAVLLWGEVAQSGAEVFGPEAVTNLVVALLCLLLMAHFQELSRQEVLVALRQRNHDLEHLSATDRLTGLANRMSLEQSLAAEVERRARGGSVFSVLLLDLDHFKRVNDTFGHATGDAVLQALAQVMERERRGSDRVGRWGGEEFVVICPQADFAGALLLGERLRAAIAAEILPRVGQQTVSIGVASHAPGESVGALLARADAGLYAAKNAGRNRVMGCTASGRCVAA